MRKFCAVVICLLSVVGLLVGCTFESKEDCIPEGFEHATVLTCKSHSTNLSILTVALPGIEAQYFTYNKAFPVEDMPGGAGTRPAVRKYTNQHVNVQRWLDIDMVELEVSEVCKGTSWELDAQARLEDSTACRYQGAAELFHKLAAEEVMVMLGEAAVTQLTQIAHDSGRQIVFAVYCISPFPHGQDGSVYTGPAGCPA